MIDVVAIRELYRYNRWANQRLFEVVSALSIENFVRDLRSSHPSVRDTLVHIVWAEWLWLQRWKGVSPQVTFPAADFPDPTTLRARWVDVEIEQRAFVDALTPERLAAAAPYVNLEGQRWQYQLWREMYHLVNHSSYHRGQITTMLRQLGAHPAATDFLVFRDDAEPRGF